MFRKVRYRCALYIVLLVSAYMVLQVLGGEGLPPWRSHRLTWTVVTDSFDSESFRVIESSDSGSIDGIYLAVVQVQIIESPVYDRDEFGFLAQGFNRIEVGRRVEVRPGVSFTAEANEASVDLSQIESTEFLRSTIMEFVSASELTPAMERVIHHSPTLSGKVLNYPRFVSAMGASIVWMLGWIAMLFELVLAHLRRKRLRRRYLNDRCFFCDYQLSRDMVQCPECGQGVDWGAYAPRRT